MNNQIEKMDLIDQYLEHSLDPEKEKKFEQELAEDPKLKDKVRQHKILVDGIRLHGRKNLLNDIQTWDKELTGSLDHQTDQTKIRPIKLYYAAAAIVLLLVSVSVIYFNIHNGYENAVASYYQPYVYISDIQRGESIDIDPLEQIYLLYDRGEYERTIQLINEIDELERTGLLQFLQANAYQAMGEYASAIPIFKKIIDSDSAYSLGSKWYLALCFLSEEKPEQAKPLLEELKDSNSSFAPKSKKLLMDIE